MKANSTSLQGLAPTRRGFSLIEILVVIVILISLAASVFVLLPKMRRKAAAANSVANLRQIGTLVALRAVDNNNRLPAARADVPDGKGGFAQLHWHETFMTDLYPDTELKEFKVVNWWETNKPFLRNPLLRKDAKPFGWDWWNPGYAMNIQITHNLGKSSGDWSAGKGGPQAYGIPLGSIPEPARTPLIAPRGNWWFTFTPSELKEPALLELLVDGKLPIMFVDGHVETMPPNEYTSRKLSEMPRKQ
jgi:prepilin-type N-terminal cleavage/methylation domain-containing protein/prepilin-type processing-associated H-X9-DG protein